MLLRLFHLFLQRNKLLFKFFLLFLLLFRKLTNFMLDIIRLHLIQLILPENVIIHLLLFWNWYLKISYQYSHNTSFSSKCVHFWLYLQNVGERLVHHRLSYMDLVLKSVYEISIFWNIRCLWVFKPLQLLTSFFKIGIQLLKLLFYY